MLRCFRAFILLMLNQQKTKIDQVRIIPYDLINTSGENAHA